MTQPFIQPKFPPPVQPEPPATNVMQKLAELRASTDPAIQAKLSELNKIVRRARRSADLTHAKRGTEAWITEFTRVLEGERPLREAMTYRAEVSL